MKFIMAGQPILVNPGFWACVAVFLVSFVGMLCVIFLILTKTEALATKPEEIGLSYWVRAARKNNRASSIFIEQRFKNLRFLMFASIIGCLGSFGILFAIGIFGERT